MVHSAPRTPVPHADREKRFLAGFGVLLLLMVGLGWGGSRSFQQLTAANRWSLHTYAVLNECEGMLETLVDMETAFRGFALSGDPRLVDQWREQRAAFLRHVARADRLTADNPAQQQRVRRLNELAARWASMQQSTGFHTAQTPEERVRAQSTITTGGPLGARSAVMRQMRDLLGTMVRSESALLARRAENAAALQRETTLLLGLGAAFSVILAAGLGLLVTSSSRNLAAANGALAAEILERRFAQRAAEHLGRQNELILESADEGICGVDVHGYVTFLNSAAARMLGRDGGDAIGRPVESVLVLEAEGDGPALSPPVRETLRSGSTERIPGARMRSVGGGGFPVELVSSPVHQDGQMTGAVVTFRDISERREVERLKDEFVSVVSHELRTPLTALRGSLGLLASGRAGQMPPHGQRLLDIAVQNADRLVRLINDILDLERLRAGKQELECRATTAAELMRSTADVMEAMAERAGLRLTVAASPLPVFADPDRILQVLTNLVSNAIKFSPSGAEVALSAELRNGDVRFAVADQGRGVPADKLELIFERFQQVDSSDARQKGGTGLGLAICRGIVEQHGGRIWAESQPGRGRTFLFTLPYRPDEARGGDAPPSAPAATSTVSAATGATDASDGAGGSVSPDSARVEHDVVAVAGDGGPGAGAPADVDRQADS
ncbi:MAG TPA: ATP-binding protein [Longimicrobiaceae bacterium]|nr:ATP-binding protein [Longimicrobiaceae bacterium]